MEAFIYVALKFGQVKSENLTLSCDTIVLSKVIKGSIRLGLAMSYYVNVIVYVYMI